MTNELFNELERLSHLLCEQKIEGENPVICIFSIRSDKAECCKYLRTNSVSFGLVGDDTIVIKSVLCGAARQIFSTMFLQVLLCILNSKENTEFFFFLVPFFPPLVHKTSFCPVVFSGCSCEQQT